MKTRTTKLAALDARYESIFGDVSRIIDAARRSAVRSVNAVMTATYWLIGRHIVEFEQVGEKRAEYGAALIKQLSADLSQRFGRGFSRQNLQQMRLFYLAHPPERIRQTPSGKSGVQTEWPIDPAIFQTASEKLEGGEHLPSASAEFPLAGIASGFPLPWSAYVRLLSVKNLHAREFYETEALRGGWSVRQLDRQINSQFYERAALSSAAHVAGVLSGPEYLSVNKNYLRKFGS